MMSYHLPLRSYHLHSRDGLILLGILLLVVPGTVFYFTITPVLQGELINETREADWLQLVVTSLFLLPLLYGGTRCLRGMYRIDMAEDGSIVLVRAVGSPTTITAADIRSLEGKYQRDYDGNQFWRLTIQYNGSRLESGEFEYVMEFVNAVRAHNPSVEITGLWPMTLPPSSQAAT